MNDLYSTPEATLVNPDGGDLDSFTRFSAWGVFGLTIITFGIYYMYWFYTRTLKLHEFHDNKISMGLVYSAMVTYIAYTALSFLDEAAYQNEFVLIASLSVMLGYFIVYLTWVFTFRSRLLDIAVANGNTQFKINPVLTFFFQALYLQYKINVYIDNKSNL